MPNWKKVIVSGSDASLNSLNVTTSLTASGLIYPTTDGTVNQVIQTDGLGNLSFGSVDTTYETVKNVSGTTLYKGTPVHATASNASGNVVGIIAASASNPATMPATFILNEDLADEAEGEAIISGLIQGVDTSLFEEGDIVYVGENSGYTNVQPTGSNLIQNLGIVTKIHPTAGAGIVLGAGRSNATPNLLNGEIFWGENNRSIQKPLAHILSGSSFTYSGSFSGSFEGDGSNLTGIQVASLQSNFNVTPFTSTGSITINHNLNATYPLVQVYDSSDNQIIPDTIEVIDADNVKITFATPRTGNVVIGKGGDIIDLTQILPPTTRAITGSFTAVTSSIINHNLDTENVLVSVYDSTKNYIIPDSIQILDGDNVQVGFSTPTTGYAVITNGGHIVSGSIEWDNVLNKPSGIVSSSAQLSDATIPGNLTIQGTLTAQQFNTEFVSASIIYRSGSTKFGDTLDDIHSFTGSLEISGSLISDGDVLPHTTDIYNLGSPTKRWGDVYLTSASIYLNSTKLSATSDGKVSGSFTGSFVGDGSQLSGVTSYTNDDTLSYINTLGVVSSSAQLSEFTGSFSGSFYGDGSNLSGVTSYTDADTLSYINSLQVLSGSVDIAKISGSNYSTFDFTNTGSITVNHNLNTLYPIVQVYDSTNSIIIPQTVQSVSTNSTKIVFGSLETGKIILSKGGDVIGSLTQQTLNAADSDILTYLNSSGVEGDILPRTTDIYNLGSPTKRWGDVYLTSASIYLNNTKLSATSDGKVSGSFTGSFVGDGSQLSGVTSYTNDDTLSYINTLGVVSSSAQLSIFSGSFSGSFTGDGSQLSGVTSYTDADTLTYINSIGVVSGSVNWDTLTGKPNGIISSSNQLSNQTIPGDLTIGGILTAQEFHTEFVSASIIYQSGSTQFGNSNDDTHTFIGTLTIDSLALPGRLVVSASGDNYINNYSQDIGKKSLFISSLYDEILTGPPQGNSDINFRVGTVASPSTALTIKETGNIGIGTTSPSNKLDVVGAVSASTYYGDGSNLTGITAGISGTGTSGYIPKWNGTTSQTNSSIYENGTTVGIGTTASETSAKLLVGGSISAGSGAIAQFNGFIRVTDYVIIQNSSVLTDQVFLQYDTSDKGLVIVKSGTANGHIRPGTNGTQNLGSSTYRWNTVYTSDLSLKNDVGDWTIVEGEEDLFLYNNKKDKVYKFNLTEVDKDSAPKKRS